MIDDNTLAADDARHRKVNPAVLQEPLWGARPRA
jgi:hypothetical protein